MRITLVALVALSVVAPSKGMSRFSKAMPKRFFLCNRTFSHLIETGNVHGVEAALSRGENLDAGERTAFEVAVENDQPGIAGLLVEEGAVDINKGSKETGQTPLHLATQKNGTALCELLLKQGADINAVDHKGRTALHYAYKNDKQNVRDLLIERGAYLAYTVEQGDSSRIAVRNMTSHEVYFVTAANEQCSNPAWCPVIA